MRRYLSIFILLSGLLNQGYAHGQLEQENPAQFISYWKSSVITSEQDQLVAYAEKVFHRLLRAWDSSRLEPGLYVVDSDKGAWAVSLVDGNILLSRQAIQTCLNFGKQRAEHLLAFVLAHELAHQRSDDLWQHRFFRQVKNRTETEILNLSQQKLRQQMDKRTLADMEMKENQADHDGLILMASVGFNPYQIVDKKDFFTEWVENIWRQSCDGQTDNILSNACNQARARAEKSSSQLDTVASQSSLYQLGVQAMVAGDYSTARYYFTHFGRDFPNRAVMSALGLTHLAEAIELRQKLIQAGAIKTAQLYYPLMLDASAGFESLNDTQNQIKRGAVDVISRQQQQLSDHVEKATSYFEKAIKLAPEVRRTYHLLANAYLINDNSFMVRGILQGRYIPKFGADVPSNLILALTASIEGDTSKAISSLYDLSQQIGSHHTEQSANDDVLAYSVTYNLSALLKFSGQPDKARIVWQQFARQVKSSPNAYLFRLALAQLQSNSLTKDSVLKVAPSINGLQLGNRKARDDSSHSINELWVEGDQYHVYNYDNGAQFITGADGKIISAGQYGGQATLGLLNMGEKAERPLKTLGLPDRRIQLVSGEYLAYDQYGLALYVNDNEIQGWFLY